MFFFHDRFDESRLSVSKISKAHQITSEFHFVRHHFFFSFYISVFKISGLQKKKKGPVHHLFFCCNCTFLWNEMNRSEKRCHVEGCFIVCLSKLDEFILKLKMSEIVK